MPFVDALKALGSQLILLHHLAFYGPMTDWTHRLFPELVGWFSQHARLAVQVFLVVAGFLAARSLAAQGRPDVQHPVHKLLQRYVRVALPCVAALLVAMVCSELARFWMTHSSIPEAPSWGQFLAHVALVQSLLDVDSLSAGVWYVAIDVQLYALLLALMALARGSAVRLMAVMVLAVMASLFHFNRSSEWDAWALYFFGAYGLGALAYWFSARDADPAWGSRAWWLVVVGLVLVALWVDFRTRVGLALGTAWLLAWSQRSGWLFTWPLSRSVDYLSRISYSVFLLNFPVALVVNAWFTRFAPADPYIQTVGVLVAWLVVNAVAAGFHHLVELRLLRLQLPKPRRYWMASAK